MEGSPLPLPPPSCLGGGGGGGVINHNFSFTYFIYDWNAHFAKDYTVIVHIEEISTEEFDIQKQSVQAGSIIVVDKSSLVVGGFIQEINYKCELMKFIQENFHHC